MRSTIFIIGLIFIFGVALGQPLCDSCQVVTVTKVLDGDTFKCEIDGKTESVRILGIDTYEVHEGERLDKQAAKRGISSDSAITLGTAGKAFADSVLLGKQVTICRMKRNRDVYHRLLRYVIIDGKSYSGMIKAHELNVRGKKKRNK